MLTPIQKKIFLFPYAGGSAHNYVKVKKAIAKLDVRLIEYPGHGKRIREQPFSEIHKIVEDSFQQIVPHIDENDDFYFFGHSMGTLVSYLVCHLLVKRKMPLPSCLFISGRGGPSKRTITENISMMSSEKFRSMLINMGGFDPILINNAAFMNMIEPILRADFIAIEQYNPVTRNPLDIPVTAFFGTEDNLTKEDMMLWQQESQYPLELLSFPGGHFFLFDQIQKLVDQIEAKV